MNDRLEGKQQLNDDPALDPYEIEFLPQFRKDRGPEAPFINEFGVVIGDHMYESEASPLEQWSVETDPAVMAGDQWVHPFKDIGFLTSDNRDRFERGVEPEEGNFAHPEHNTASGVDKPNKRMGMSEREQSE